MARERFGIRSVLGLLDRGRPEAACAAAIVLGELRATDPRVRRALAKRLPLAPPHVRPYVRDAIGRAPDDAAIARLVRELGGTGVAREQAKRLLVGLGDRAVPHLRRAAEAPTEDAGRHLFAVAAQIGTQDALDWLADAVRRASDARARALRAVLGPRAQRSWPRLRRSAWRTRCVLLVRGGAFASAEAIRLVFATLEASDARR